jgi:hypothetical protein
MTKIEKIWVGLESENFIHSGLLYRRYSAEVSTDIFVAIKAPEKLRCIAFRLNTIFNLYENRLNNLKDIKIELFGDERDNSNKFLLIILQNKQHKDIFSTLCEDLIIGVSGIISENKLVNKLLERLAKWQLLFEKAEQQGLTEEAQRGLYGEVYFLRFFLKNTPEKNYCIRTWKGPEKSIQDFRHSNWAVEVKTSHGNNHQKIPISNERQLDDTLTEKIFLYHLSLEVKVGSGESLNRLIEEVLEILNEDICSSNLFKMKLLEAGYFDTHKSMYEESAYTIRQENLFRVSGNFPRITESQTPSGVGNVKYSIVLAGLDEWRIDYETLFEEII